MKPSMESHQGALGVTEVARSFERLGWGTIVNSRHDYGTDLFMLVIDRAGGDRGLLVGAQVKAGTSFFREVKMTDDGEALGWWFRDGNRSHVDAWAAHAVPHLIVLHDLKSEKSYWAHVTPENIVSTGKGAKVFVPKCNLVDDANREKLERVAAGAVGHAGWEESAWTGKAPPTTDDGLRYAMMVPRLVAPHPNAGDGSGLTPEQGLALLVQVRIRDYERIASAHASVPTLDQATRSKDWRWRFVGAFGEWLLEQNPEALYGLTKLAPTSAARSAATVASACALIEQEKMDEAITLLDEARRASGNSSVDEAWLGVQYARCCAEIGRLDQARKVAIAVQAIRPSAARDVTAAAILGTAATLVFNTSGWGENLDEVITAGDTAAVWWRSQVTRWGLEALTERNFKAWSRDTSVTIAAVDVVVKEFESSALLASHGADQGGWRHLRALRGQSELLQLDRTGDAEQAHFGLHQLLQAGDSASLKLAVPHLIADGPATAITLLGTDLRLGQATRTTAFAELTVIELGGSMLDVKAADRVVRWILRTLRNPDPYAERISASFVVKWQLLDSLAGVISAASLRVQRQVIRYLVEMPSEVEQVFATAWRKVLGRLPSRAWTRELALQAKPKPREHHSSLRIGLLGISARYDAGAQRSLYERARRGSLDALSGLGSVARLPPRVAGELIERMARQVERQIAEAHQGRSGFGPYDVPEALVLLNVWHPEQAQWTPIIEQLSDSVVAIESKERALVVLANLADRLPEQVREELKPVAASLCREEIGGRENPFEPDRDLVGRATRLAIVLGAIDPTEDEAPLVRLLQGNAERRRWAAFLATHLRRPSDIGVLAALTSDPHPMVRASAAGGLASVFVAGWGGEMVPVLLRGCLDDGGAWVPDAIAGVLGGRDAQDGADVVAEELLVELRSHPSATVRRSARGEN